MSNLHAIIELESNYKNNQYFAFFDEKRELISVLKSFLIWGKKCLVFYSNKEDIIYNISIILTGLIHILE